MATSTKIPTKSSRLTRRNIVLTVLAIVLAAAGGTGYYLWKNHSVSAAAQKSTLQTAAVTRGNIKLFASGTGSLIPSVQSTFGFRSAGQVKEVLVKVGDVVDSGQLLATLDDTSAQEQYQTALRARNDLSSPGAIATATSDVANDKVKVVTTRATLAYLISPAVLYWEEQVASAETALQQAKDEAAAHPSTDADKKVKSAEQLLQVCKNNLAQAWLDYWNDYVPETFLTVVTEGRTSTKKVIPPTEADIAAARADYALAKQTLLDDQNYLTAITTGAVPAGASGSKISAFQQAQQDVETAKTAIENTKLYAPIHGTVLSIGFAAGDTAGSSSIITVADLDQPYTLEIYLDQSDWTNIAVGYPVEVTFDLLPDNIYTGKVTAIDPDLTNTNGNLYVHAYILLDTNVKITLPFGTSASVDVIGGEATGVLLVPVEALHEISSGTYAVFVMVNGKPELRMVEVGLKDATHAEIKSGLQEGDTVTTGIMETK